MLPADALREVVRRHLANQPMPKAIGITPFASWLTVKFLNDRAEYQDVLQAQQIGCGAFPATNADVAAQLSRRLNERNPRAVQEATPDPREQLRELARLAADGHAVPPFVGDQPTAEWLDTFRSDYAEFPNNMLGRRLGCPHGATNHEVAEAVRTHLSVDKARQ